MAKMLLDEFGSTVDEVTNVSTVFTTLGAVGGGVRLWSYYGKVLEMVVFTVTWAITTTSVLCYSCQSRCIATHVCHCPVHVGTECLACATNVDGLVMSLCTCQSL